MSKREASAPCAYSDGSEVVMGVLDSAAYDPPRAFVRITGGDDLVNPHVADLLRAVSEAFDVKVVPADAIVIEAGKFTVEPAENEDLYGYRLKATAPSGRFWIRPREWYETSVDFALAILAAADYAKWNLPVDEAEVERLAKSLYEATSATDRNGLSDIARRLYLAGVRAPEVTK